MRREAPTSAAAVGSLIENLLFGAEFALLILLADAATIVEEERRVSDRPNNDVDDDDEIDRRARLEIGNSRSIIIILSVHPVRERAVLSL